MQPILAVDVDAGLLGAAGAVCISAGYGVRWLLTRKDNNDKTLTAGLWDIIHAKDEQIKAQDANCNEMKATFNALVIELARTRNKHARCEAKILELRQCTVNLHGTLKEVVKASANPNMFIPELPPFHEEDWEIDDESRAVDKQVKEVVQNAKLLEASKKLSESSLRLPSAANGGKP